MQSARLQESSNTKNITPRETGKDDFPRQTLQHVNLDPSYDNGTLHAFQSVVLHFWRSFPKQQNTTTVYDFCTYKV